MSDQQVAIAKAIAWVAHHGQADKSGAAYIGHPARVAQKLVEAKSPERVVAAGWLHDVIEDSSLTRDDLFAAGVDWSVINIVEAVTRTKEVSPEDYYSRIGQSQDATAVKLADIADNTDPERLAVLDDATIARLTRKYAKARALIAQA